MASSSQGNGFEAQPIDRSAQAPISEQTVSTSPSRSPPSDEHAIDANLKAPNDILSTPGSWKEAAKTERENQPYRFFQEPERHGLGISALFPDGDTVSSTRLENGSLILSDQRSPSQVLCTRSSDSSDVNSSIEESDESPKQIFNVQDQSGGFVNLHFASGLSPDSRNLLQVLRIAHLLDQTLRSTYAEKYLTTQIEDFDKDNTGLFHKTFFLGFDASLFAYAHRLIPQAFILRAFHLVRLQQSGIRAKMESFLEVLPEMKQRALIKIIENWKPHSREATSKEAFKELAETFYGGKEVGKDCGVISKPNVSYDSDEGNPKSDFSEITYGGSVRAKVLQAEPWKDKVLLRYLRDAVIGEELKQNISKPENKYFAPQLSKQHREYMARLRGVQQGYEDNVPFIWKEEKYSFRCIENNKWEIVQNLPKDWKMHKDASASQDETTNQGFRTIRFDQLFAADPDDPQIESSSAQDKNASRFEDVSAQDDTESVVDPSASQELPDETIPASEASKKKKHKKKLKKKKVDKSEGLETIVEGEAGSSSHTEVTKQDPSVDDEAVTPSRADEDAEEATQQLHIAEEATTSSHAVEDTQELPIVEEAVTSTRTPEDDQEISASSADLASESAPVLDVATPEAVATTVEVEQLSTIITKVADTVASVTALAAETLPTIIGLDVPAISSAKGESVEIIEDITPVSDKLDPASDLPQQDASSNVDEQDSFVDALEQQPSSTVNESNLQPTVDDSNAQPAVSTHKKKKNKKGGKKTKGANNVGESSSSAQPSNALVNEAEKEIKHEEASVIAPVVSAPEPVKRTPPVVLKKSWADEVEDEVAEQEQALVGPSEPKTAVPVSDVSVIVPLIAKSVSDTASAAIVESTSNIEQPTVDVTPTKIIKPVATNSTHVEVDKTASKDIEKPVEKVIEPVHDIELVSDDKSTSIDKSTGNSQQSASGPKPKDTKPITSAESTHNDGSTSVVGSANVSAHTQVATPMVPDQSSRKGASASNVHKTATKGPKHASKVANTKENIKPVSDATPGSGTDSNDGFKAITDAKVNKSPKKAASGAKHASNVGSASNTTKSTSGPVQSDNSDVNKPAATHVKPASNDKSVAKGEPLDVAKPASEHKPTSKGKQSLTENKPTPAVEPTSKVEKSVNKLTKIVSDIGSASRSVLDAKPAQVKSAVQGSSKHSKKAGNASKKGAKPAVEAVKSVVTESVKAVSKAVEPIVKGGDSAKDTVMPSFEFTMPARKPTSKAVEPAVTMPARKPTNKVTDPTVKVPDSTKETAKRSFEFTMPARKPPRKFLFETPNLTAERLRDSTRSIAEQPGDINAKKVRKSPDEDASTASSSTAKPNPYLDWADLETLTAIPPGQRLSSLPSDKSRFKDTGIVTPQEALPKAMTRVRDYEVLSLQFGDMEIGGGMELPEGAITHPVLHFPNAQPNGEMPPHVQTPKVHSASAPTSVGSLTPLFGGSGTLVFPPGHGQLGSTHSDHHHENFVEPTVPFTCSCCRTEWMPTRQLPTYLCSFCGPASNVRYCSRVCMLADAFDHCGTCMSTPYAMTSVEVPFGAPGWMIYDKDTLPTLSELPVEPSRHLFVQKVFNAYNWVHGPYPDILKVWAKKFSERAVMYPVMDESTFRCGEYFIFQDEGPITAVNKLSHTKIMATISLPQSHSLRPELLRLLHTTLMFSPKDPALVLLLYRFILLILTSPSLSHTIHPSIPSYVLIPAFRAQFAHEFNIHYSAWWAGEYPEPLDFGREWQSVHEVLARYENGNPILMINLAKKCQVTAVPEGQMVWGGFGEGAGWGRGEVGVSGALVPRPDGYGSGEQRGGGAGEGSNGEGSVAMEYYYT